MISGISPYPEYKDSSTEWFGQIPAHWEVSHFAAIGRLKSIVNQADRQLLSVYLHRGVVKFADVEEKRTNATSEDLSKYQAVDPGDLVLNNQQAWRGSVGVSNDRGIVSPAYLVIALSEQYLPRFANLLFRDQGMVSQYRLCSKGVGTIQRNLYWPQVKRVAVPVPPISEQTAILRFMDWANLRLGQVIKGKQKIVALLSDQKQAIVHRAMTCGLDQTVPKSHTGIAWLGEIPSHWKVTRACRVFSQVTRFIARGNEPKMSMSRHHGLVRSELLLNSKAAQSATSIRFSVCLPGDLIVNKYQAHNGLFAAATERGLITSNYSVFAPTLEEAKTQFYAMLLASPLYRAEFRMRCQGVGEGMMPLYSNAFLKTPLVSPPAAEQEAIVAFVAQSTKALTLTISCLEREIELLREYRSRLAADVVTGKLDVRSAAARLPDDVMCDLIGGEADVDEDPEEEIEEAIA